MTGTGKYEHSRSTTGKILPSRGKVESVGVFKRERDNFRRMKPELTDDPHYHDKFVAVRDNLVVGTAACRLDLFLQMSKIYSEGTYFIGKIYPPK
ncbi:hypothetical protein KKB99_07295 [bacterium]|nr:hypothetical protein [bacterium]MBU1025797.1 hypothetical protein [bacterium]